MLTRLATGLARRPVTAGVVAVLVTALLSIPLLTMAPTSSASQEPDGAVFDARDVLDDRLSPAIGESFFVLEAAGAAEAGTATGEVTDLLEPDELRLVHDRLEAMREAFADIVVTVTDPVTGLDVVGALTIADVVDATLAQQGLGGLATAPDEAVDATVATVVEQVGPANLGLSAQTERNADGTWSSPAMSIRLLLDNEALGGGTGGATIGTDDLTREETLRAVRDVLRGGAPDDGVTIADSGELVVHAIAVDANLTAAEQGEAAGPFIGLVVLLTVLLVGVVFRSYWSVAIVGAGVTALMVWLQGLSNLIGLEQDQILAIVVPIALISFGVDFAFHALGRVREERDAGHVGRNAVAVGLAGVGGALLLAVASDTAAFMSNTLSGIESIVQFGVAASLGLVSAFVLLGLVTPAVDQAVTDHVAAPRRGALPTAGRVLGSVLAAVAAMTAVLLTVFVVPAVGVALTLAYPLLFVALPAWVRGRPGSDRASVDAIVAGAVGAVAGANAEARTTQHGGAIARWLGSFMLAVARRGAIVLPVALLITAVSSVGALQLETAFDVEDFFSADTDFVIALNALDDHVGSAAGEPATIVVQSDLEDPAVVAALAREVDALRALDGDVFAVGDDGLTIAHGGVVDVVRDAVRVPTARAAVEAATGVALVDADGDGVPDDAAGLRAVYEVATTAGLPLDETRLLWAPDQLEAVLDRGGEGQLDVTRLLMQIPGSREVTVVDAASEILEPREAALTEELDALAPGSTAIATGAPFVRQGQLDAVTRALLLSLPVSILACLAVAFAAMRSVRYALIAIVPILMVVPWLYGLMERMGYSINLVTGTIGAISIGIGIDFAIHLVERFREERARHADRDEALRATAEGTGLALVASAGSSIIGFAVLAFAPMPMFATYGLLTAIMIAMALSATLLVLPALLRATTPPVVPVAETQVAPAVVLGDPVGTGGRARRGEPTRVVRITRTQGARTVLDDARRRVTDERGEPALG